MSSRLSLVTGVTGFVGSNLARLLLEKGERVRALVRPGSDLGNVPVHPQLEIAWGDLRDFVSVKRAMEGCQTVYHVAADYRFWARDPRELYESNVGGTTHVLQAARECHVERVVYTSTVGTIGLADQPKPCNEETPHAPGQLTSHYKRSKLEAEQVALDFARQGVPIVIVNPSTPIGPWDRKPTPTGKIIVDFVKGRIPATVETGLCFVHVRDVAEGHWLAGQKGRLGERYILGGENLSMHAFLSKIAAECLRLGVRGAPKNAPSLRIPYCIAWMTGVVSTRFSDWVTHRPPAVPLEAVKMSKRAMYFDSSKAVRELGLPQTPVEQAIADALTWFSESGYFLNPAGQKKGERAHVSPV